MDSTNLLPTIAWAIVILLFVLGIARQSREEKRDASQQANAKTKSAAEAAAATDEEIAYVQEAGKHAPRYADVVSHLRTKYSWLDLVSVLGLRRKHLGLLREIGSQQELTLPNLDASPLSELERQIIQKVKGGATDLDKLLGINKHDIEDLSSSPTTETLDTLVRLGFVTTTPSVNQTQRTYLATSTKKGKAFLALDRTHHDKDEGGPRLMNEPRSPEARKAIAKYIQLAILPASASAA